MLPPRAVLPTPDLAATAPDPLLTPIRQALAGPHAAFALRNGRAIRYPSAMLPFASVEPSLAGAAADLQALLAPGETVFVEATDFVDSPTSPAALFRDAGLDRGVSVPCVQMGFPATAPLPITTTDLAIVPLSCANVAAMLALIAAAFPGYFRPETCRLGRYFGVWESGRTGARLLGMVGERFQLYSPVPDGRPALRELSALAVHPDAAGRGLGTALLAHLLTVHRAEGSYTWLFASTDNTRAITLYEHLGFEHLRQIEMLCVTRANG